MTWYLSVYFSVAPESPRWLVSVHRDDDAKKVLERIATVNGTKLPEELNLEDNRENVSMFIKCSAC